MSAEARAFRAPSHHAARTGGFQGTEEEAGIHGTPWSRFLNKNAYIQIALLGKKFCFAAKDAFWLIFRNALRIATAALVSPYPHRDEYSFVVIHSSY